jgi:hypothetical protein
MAEYDPIQVAWAAGILEGEGCFSICTRKTAKHDHKTLAVHCEMTDEDVVRKLHSVFQVGTVVERKNMSGRRDTRTRKITFIWSVQNHKGISEVCNLILPHMGARRKQKILELIEYVESRK